MTGDEAVLLIEQFLSKQGRVKKDNSVLTLLEKQIVLGHWEGKRYWKIAEDTGNDVTYIKQVGSKLWAALSEATGEKVSKPNLKTVLLGLRVDRLNETPPSAILSHLQVTQTVAEVEKFSEVENNSSTSSSAQTLPIVLGDYLPLPPQVFGRGDDLKLLQKAFQPSVTEGLRGVFLTGPLGIGKTTLAAQFAATVTGFDRVIWLSLLDRLPLNALLRKILHYLPASGQPESGELDDQLLLEAVKQTLRASRHLIVLNGVEQILGDDTYKQFIGQVLVERHQSCFLFVTDWEDPMIVRWRKTSLSIQIEVKDLDAGSSHALLTTLGISDVTDRKELIELYKGNPFLLNTAARTIETLFSGDSKAFISLKTTLYTGGIRSLLIPLFERMTTMEKNILICLSQSSFTTPLELQKKISHYLDLSTESLIEGIESLHYRRLIEIERVGEKKQQTVYSLQPMIRKHVLKTLLPIEK